MVIGGLQKFSLLDYPDNISAIVFTQGCNFKCQFCYNPMLVGSAKVSRHRTISAKGEGNKKGHSLIKEDDLFDFFKKRIGKLDAVVITGGEPTIHLDLPGFIAKIKKLGFKVKLDTNGTNPKMLKKLIKEKLVDYIAMDIKAPKNKYEKITGKKIDFKKIEKSVKIIMESKLPYEFRATVVKGLLSKEDIAKIAKIIKGADILYLQQIKQDTELINRSLEKVNVYTNKDLLEMRKLAKKSIKKCKIR